MNETKRFSRKIAGLISYPFQRISNALARLAERLPGAQYAFKRIAASIAGRNEPLPWQLAGPSGFSNWTRQFLQFGCSGSKVGAT